MTSPRYRIFIFCVCFGFYCFPSANSQSGSDWVPIIPAPKPVLPSDFSRRTYEVPLSNNRVDNTLLAVNSISEKKVTPGKVSVNAGSSPSLKKEIVQPVYKLENLKQRVGITTKNVLPYHPVNFSALSGQRSYKSSFKRNGRGMDEIYIFVNHFLDFIQPGKALPPDFEFTTNPSELLSQIVENWQTFLFHYIGIASCVGIGIFLTIIVPVTGLFICICRCCCKCGTGDDHYETKKDACKRGTYGFFFGTFLVLVAFGVVISFVSNFNVEDGLHSLPEKVGDSRDDVSTFLENTKQEVNNLMVDNYKELETALGQALDDCGNLVRNELARVSSAIAVDQLNGIVDNVNEITADLVGISKETQELIRNSKILKEDLRDIRAQIRGLLDSCRGRVPSCADLETKFNNLAVVDLDQQFEKLPEINDVARRLSEFLNSSIKQEILKGVSSLNSISAQVDSAIKNFVEDDVKIQIKRSGEMLNKTAQDIGSVLQQGVAMLHGATVNETIGKSRDYVTEYAPYRLYADLAVCGVILAIFTTLSLGLMCGCCGRKPTSRYDGCGTRALGGRWVKCGVIQIFLFFAFLMSAAVVHFFVGSVAEKLICDEQMAADGNSEGPVFMEMLDRSLNLDQYFPENARPTGVQISTVLNECRRDSAIYQALRLHKVQNLSILQSLPDQLRIDELVNRLISNVQVSEETFVILTEDAKEQLEKLARSELSKSNYSNYSMLLENQITGINLMTFSSELRKTARSVTTYDSEVAVLLMGFADRLERDQQVAVQAMQDSARSLKVLAARIELNIKFNETSIEDAVKKLVGLAENAEVELQTNGALMLQEVAQEFGKDFEKLIRDYVYRVGNYTEKEIGKCSPVSRAVFVPVEALCRGVIDPLNGFWASVGWSLIFFILIAIIGLSLIDLYRKTEDYAPANTQPSFMYYAYGDRDNIPVSNVRPYDPHTAFNYEGDYPEFPPHVGGKSLSSVNGDGARNRSSLVSPVDSRNGRYQDHAMKAWAGSSPPRYSSSLQQSAAPAPAPSQEFERPPPYYYPGPANLPP